MQRETVKVLKITADNRGELDHLDEYTLLLELQCYNNRLTALPILPESLTKLYCNNNPLTEMFLELPDINFAYPIYAKDLDKIRNWQKPMYVLK